MSEATDIYQAEAAFRQAEWARLRASLAEHEQVRVRRDFVLMAWGLVLAFGFALAGVAEPLGLEQYLPKDLPLWIMSIVGIACFTAILGLLLQYRLLRERAADGALRREIEDRLDELSRKQGG